MEKPRVFFVYGHDTNMMLAVKDFVQNDLGMSPCVLNIHNHSGSILDAFIRESKDCDKTIVFMTSDDTINNDYKQARPNVFIEFGYMLHQCGKNNVVVVADATTKFPSDIDNMIHVRYGNENWKEDLRQELSRGDHDINDSQRTVIDKDEDQLENYFIHLSMPHLEWVKELVESGNRLKPEFEDDIPMIGFDVIEIHGKRRSLYQDRDDGMTKVENDIFPLFKEYFEKYGRPRLD